MKENKVESQNIAGAVVPSTAISHLHLTAPPLPFIPQLRV
jgi:hypothetical protein